MQCGGQCTAISSRIGTINMWKITLLVGVMTGFQFPDTGAHSTHFSLDIDKEPVNALNDNNFVQDASHLQEHMDRGADVDLSQATPEELAFYFFHFHDRDQDRRLDGIELFAALIHGIEEAWRRMQREGFSPLNLHEQIHLYTSHVIKMVDRIISDADTDDDGYLTYAEYSKSRNTSDYVTKASRQHLTP